MQKPTLEGPAAYVIGNDEAHANRQVELVKVLKRQHVEVQQLSAAATCDVPGEKRGDKPKQETFAGGQHRGAHGPALFARRRCAARSAVLGAGRSAEASLRRHGLVVQRSCST